tara:strand:+ start:6931 stop:7377 length:447 start_codon:yes stop_codon:yes gene_type:complete
MTIDIMEIVKNHLKEISEKTTLGYNGYYQYITWEITSDGLLFDHWLGGNESIKLDDGSTSFQTKIFRDTDFILYGCIDNNKDEIELYAETQILCDYASELQEKNIISHDGKILDIQDFTAWCYHEFYDNECMEFLLERIEQQLAEGGE